MTAAVLARMSEFRGLRPLDQGRDLAAVADLIEGAFPARIDAPGKRMLREMRWLGRSGWFGRLLTWMLLPGSPYSQGYVWEEAGRVVGNASLMRVEEGGGRWVLANVVVHPAFQRRGIGRALVEASLEHVRRSGGSHLILQVESTNTAAQRLYAALGFQARTTRTTWSRAARAGAEALKDSSAVRGQRADEWQLEWSLASRLHPEGLLWPLPLRADLFRPAVLSETIRIEGRGRWVWPSEGEPRAFLSAHPLAEPRGWRLTLLVEPTWRGQAAGPLLARAVRWLGGGRTALTIEYPAAVAEEAFVGAGFQPERTLTWMELDLRRATD
ncbi:MAG: GNAT family N-acetyltransferase [Chloroflexota bacterium]